MILRIAITILVYGFLGWLLCDIDPNKRPITGILEYGTGCSSL